MAKPVIFAIDDDLDVVRALDRDLRQHYGNHFRVLHASSGSIALETLGKLKLRNEVVALFLVDQRMPHRSGIEFLKDAIQLFPEARRVLLTAYADTDAAISAINTARIDYYMVKPWDPPEQNLYPVLDDILSVWQASYHPPFEGIRIIGHRWSPQSHLVKDFLARNLVPYQWLDIETVVEAKRLLDFIPEEQLVLPVVLFPDASYLSAPTVQKLAEKAQLKTHVEATFYDLIIVGSGPAGLAAAVYGASEGLRTLLIEREAPGGQAGTSSRIENYLGFPSGLSGADLSRRGVAQAQRLGAELLTSQEVVSVRIEGPYRFVKLNDGSEISCHVLLVAAGVAYRKLDIPSLQQFTGAGVYYGAAMSEAISCSDEHVYIVGGANSAGQAAMYFAKYASHVTILVRSSGLSQSMSRYLIDQIAATPNITLRICSTVVEAHGDDHLEAITVEDANSGERQKVDTTSLFIFIGAMPYTDWIGDMVERDAQGFIVTGPDLMHEAKLPPSWPLKRDPFLLEASVPGIFVAGDVRHGSVKRVASAVGEGSIAVQFIHRYLSEV